VFIVEGLLLLFMSGLFALLLVLVVREGTLAWYTVILLLCAAFGLITLGWMFVRYGLFLKTPPPQMNGLTWAGWIVGNCLAVFLIGITIRERKVELTLQALAYFGPLIAMSVHLLVRYWRARQA
jgi:hypothetical protein